jgi:hypothetical protein
MCSECSKDAARKQIIDGGYTKPLPEKPDPAALMPCPFCGGNRLSVCETDFHDHKVYAVSCAKVKCHGGIWALGHGEFPSPDEAVKAWNTRAALQPQPSADGAAMLDEVEEALAEYQVATDGERSEARERWRTARAAVLARMSTPPGYKLVPVEPTEEMLDAAIDAHGLKLGCIAPLGLRMSPQMMFEKSYAAMLAAAPTEVK